MGIRTTGLISNLDTESIIKELMSVQTAKKTKIENNITKLEWKQEKWKDLNDKIYALYTDSLAKMKLQSTYLAKSATSSSDNLTVSASSSAAEGVHTVQVNQMASSQYLTSAALDSSVTSSTLLSDLGFATDGSAVVTFQKEGEDAVSLTIDEDTTLYDFLASAKEAGLNASYDTTNHRIFISSGTSGTDGAFSITSNTSSSVAERTAVKTAVGYDSLSTANQATVNEQLNDYRNAILAGDTDAEVTAEDAVTEIALQTITDRVESETEATYRAGLASESDFSQTELDQLISDALASQSVVDELDAKALEVSNAFANYSTAISNESLTSDSSLTNLGLENVTYTITDGVATYNEMTSGATLVGAANGGITYNGVTLTGNSNTYTVNGLTFTVNSQSAVGETISVNVSKDVDAAYQTVKDFVTQYNELLQEMNDLYYADSASGYDVLTDDEKEQMTDDQIDKWETKIKDSLLRNDSTLGSLLSTMKTGLSSMVTVDGTSYALTTFGIATGDYSEKGLLHIYGDEEDSYGADFTDKLKTALENDPDTVMSVLTQVTGNLYSAMTEKMGTSSISSALTFYNDKQLDSQKDDYEDQLAEMEDRLTALEDRYYDQFTAMETAMANITSTQNTLASMLGTSSS